MSFAKPVHLEAIFFSDHLNAGASFMRDFTENRGRILGKTRACSNITTGWINMHNHCS